MLERTTLREGVREIDLVSDEEREKLYGMEIGEIKDSPGLNIDIAFITCFHTRLVLETIARSLPERPKFLPPIEHSYFVLGNRPIPPFSKHFELQKIALRPQQGCLVCGHANQMQGAACPPATFASSCPEAALMTVFDECDSFTDDETGGRVIGTYRETRGELTIEVTGIIEPGPSARRSRVSFFQDGPYQEGIFRQIEQQHPEIEHLGNWHTHHVNGLPHLSGGDITTYTRTVDHKNHNTSFFYALLVIAKNAGATGLSRYVIKHYVFHRGGEHVL